MGAGVKCREAILGYDEDICLSVVLNQQGSRMGGADGAVFFPRNLAILFVQADQIARSRVMVPGKQHRIAQNEGAYVVAPRHFRIAEQRDVARHPNQLAIVGVTSDVGIAKGNVDRIFRDRGGVGGEVRFLMGTLIDAETEIMSPKLTAVDTIKAERQGATSYRPL